MTDAALDAADPQQAAACRRLWAAAVLLAIADAEADPLGPPGAYLRSADFRMIADLAGLDAETAQLRIAIAHAARPAEADELKLTRGRKSA